MMDRSPFVAPVNHVNPLDINKREQRGAMERIAQALPINPDRLSAHQFDFWSRSSSIFAAAY